MGIHDRDYDREHHRKVTPIGRKPAPWSTGRIGVFWIVLFAAIFGVIRYASRTESATHPQVPQAAVVPTPLAQSVTRSAAPSVVVPQAPVQRYDPASGPAPIYRCGNSYGTAPCANGRPVDGPAASGFDSRPTESLASLVARGRSSDSNTVTTVTNTVTTMENGVVTSATGGEPGRLTICRQLAADIEWIDRAARQPQSAGGQDRLRARRREIRDAQARSHC